MLIGSIILSIGIFNGTMLATTLWFAKRSRFMAVGILVYSLMLLKYLGYWVDFLPEQRLLSEVLRPIELLLGPLVLGCFYRLSGKRLYREWLHYLPALLLLLFVVGNYLSITLTSTGTYAFGYYVFLTKMTHELAYLIVVLWFFRKALNRVRVLLIAFFSLQWIISIFYLLYRFEGNYNVVNYILFTGMVFSVNYMAFVALKQSSMLSKRAPVPGKKKQDPAPKAKSDTPKQELDLLPVFEALVAKLEQEAFFLSQNLKISDLARELAVPEKSVSRAVNEHAGENFNAFINRYRVNHAAELIMSDSHSHFTIDAIAEESGFANKVSFYKAFKRTKGISPNEYRKAQLLANNNLAH